MEIKPCISKELWIKIHNLFKENTNKSSNELLEIINFDVNLDSQDDIIGSTLIGWSCYYDNEKIFDKLLELKVNINIVNCDDRSVFDFLVYNGKKDMMEKIIKLIDFKICKISVKNIIEA